MSNIGFSEVPTTKPIGYSQITAKAPEQDRSHLSGYLQVIANAASYLPNPKTRFRVPSPPSSWSALEQPARRRHLGDRAALPTSLMRALGTAAL